jgi:hypothetical protein
MAAAPVERPPVMEVGRPERAVALGVKRAGREPPATVDRPAWRLTVGLVGEQAQRAAADPAAAPRRERAAPSRGTRAVVVAVVVVLTAKVEAPAAALRGMLPATTPRVQGTRSLGMPEPTGRR